MTATSPTYNGPAPAFIVTVEEGGVIRLPASVPVGATVAVVVVSPVQRSNADSVERERILRDLRELFKTTQDLVRPLAISEDDIQAEIAAYRQATT